jgi:16S rRNA (cytosine1402-N4)-methyltransferase
VNADDERDGREESGVRPYASDYHAPVLCKIAVDGLVTDTAGTYVDGTLGGGGHTAALLDRLGSKASVFGIDRDEDAIAFASRRLVRDLQSGRLHVVHGNVADLVELLHPLNVVAIDGLLLDLGVSSYQLDTGSRGFSHAREGKLDMRMDQAENAPGDHLERVSAGALVNASSEQELRDVLFRFGEEPRARRIAAAVVSARPLETTSDLASVVRATVPRDVENKTLARVFQAIRIAVNRELEALEGALRAAATLIRPGGRLVVISYHSLEDRIVKRFMRSGDATGEIKRDVYGNALAPFRPIGRVTKADADEAAANPRSRSARMRIAERIQNPSDSTPP